MPLAVKEEKISDITNALLESIRETPVLELTEEAKEIIETGYGKCDFILNHRVIGKFEQSLPFSHSIKDRAAVYMLVNALESGEINASTKFIVEATSGNMGIALAKASRQIGLPVLVIVSRRIEEGVIRELESAGAQIVLLNTEICPVPGANESVSIEQASFELEKIKEALAKVGVAIDYKEGEDEIIMALKENDAIKVAKLVAKVYGGFCPRQYENPANYLAHVATTAPEVEHALKAIKADPHLTTLFLSAGTLGTALGFLLYYSKGGSTPLIEIVFPKDGQDVPGIRTKKSVEELPFYKELVRLQERKEVKQVVFSEVDYLKEGMLVYANTGIGIGPSASLAFAAAITSIRENEEIARMLAENKLNEALNRYGAYRVEMVKTALSLSEPLVYFVMMPDGKEKYKSKTREVSVEEARALIKIGYSLAWVYPRELDEKTKEAIAERLGIDKGSIEEIGEEALDVLSAYYYEEATYHAKLEKLMKRLERAGKNVIFLCPHGNTSKLVADIINESKGEKDLQVCSLYGGSEGILAGSE